MKLISLSHTSKSRTLSFALCWGQHALKSSSKTLCRLSAPLAPFLDWGNTGTHSPWKPDIYKASYINIYTYYTHTYGTNCWGEISSLNLFPGFSIPHWCQLPAWWAEPHFWLFFAPLWPPSTFPGRVPRPGLLFSSWIWGLPLWLTFSQLPNREESLLLPTPLHTCLRIVLNSSKEFDCKSWCQTCWVRRMLSW